MLLLLLPSAAGTRSRGQVGEDEEKEEGGGRREQVRAGLRAPPRPPPSPALPAPGPPRCWRGSPAADCWGAAPLGVLGGAQGVCGMA